MQRDVVGMNEYKDIDNFLLYVCVLHVFLIIIAEKTNAVGNKEQIYAIKTKKAEQAKRMTEEAIARHLHPAVQIVQKSKNKPILIAPSITSPPLPDQQDQKSQPSS